MANPLRPLDTITLTQDEITLLCGALLCGVVFFIPGFLILMRGLGRRLLGPAWSALPLSKQQATATAVCTHIGHLLVA